MLIELCLQTFLFLSFFFFRSVTYSINKFYRNHVTVIAEVVPVGLELSTESLIVKPCPGMPAEAGNT
jgi:hypothetical protein